MGEKSISHLVSDIFPKRKDQYCLQVSRYIDASMLELGRGAVEDVDRTYGVLLEEGGEEGPENASFALQPPLANQEEFTSRPESSISRSPFTSSKRTTKVLFY